MLPHTTAAAPASYAQSASQALLQIPQPAGSHPGSSYHNASSIVTSET